MKELIKINKKFLFLVLALTFINANITAQSNKKFTVVIDAGHGGHDGGANGKYSNEKDVTLSTSLMLGKLLQKEKDIKVVYTRTTDIFVALAKRAQIANDVKADLFISIHCNSAHSKAQGTETWVLGSEENRQGDNFNVVKRENSVIYLEDDYEKTYEGFDPNSAEDLITMTLIQGVHYENSIYFAQNIENEFKKDNRTSRGVKQSGFAVLWRTAMPSVLIEIGFVSNPTEGAYLSHKNGQKEVANSIFTAFKKYKEIWDKKHNHTKTKPKPKVVERPEKDIIYKIQFLASKNLYKEGDMQLRGLKNIEVIKQGDFYKYFYGSTSLKSEKEKLLKETKKYGFSTSFVQEFSLKKSSKQFAIQLLDSSKKYSVKNKLFKKFYPITRIKNKKTKTFNYITSWNNDFKKVESNLKKAQKSGFKSAILVMK